MSWRKSHLCSVKSFVRCLRLRPVTRWRERRCIRIEVSTRTDKTCASSPAANHESQISDQSIPARISNRISLNQSQTAEAAKA